MVLRSSAGTLGSCAAIIRNKIATKVWIPRGITVDSLCLNPMLPASSPRKRSLRVMGQWQGEPVALAATTKAARKPFRVTEPQHCIALPEKFGQERKAATITEAKPADADGRATAKAAGASICEREPGDDDRALLWPKSPCGLRCQHGGSRKWGVRWFEDIADGWKGLAGAALTLDGSP
jgi:hypothetical protein